MKTIDKIIAYCRKVEKAERPKQGDKEEYSHGKYAVASSVLKLVELNQPEPPTLRPMSELPEFERVNIKVARFNAPEGSFWIIGMKRINHKGGTSIESSHCCFVEEKEVFVNYSHGAKVEGWLPLPNPDEIKLPC